MTTLENSFLKLKSTKVIDAIIDYKNYIPLNLNVSNTELAKIDIKSAAEFEIYIEDLFQKKEAKVAYGGYNEKRYLYNQNGHFNNQQAKERNIHIGLDLWIKAGTAVIAPLDGTIHSFKNNLGTGDYGPTIILKHELDGMFFHTLYGHLSTESLQDIKIGDLVKQGSTIATLGDATVNGGYSPHLHFQIIKNIANYYGDYPGVCSADDLNYYLENCPDPNLLLKIERD